MTDEGSVQVEGYAFDSEGMDGEESQVEETQTDETTDDTQETAEVPATETTEETQDTTVEETESEDTEEVLTDKGTKLDKNPASAAYQQLANAKVKMGKYEKILTNPTLLSEYAKQMGLEISGGKSTKADAVTEEAVQDDLAELITADNMDDVDKITGVVKKVHSHYQGKLTAQEQRIKRLEDQLGGVAESSKREAVLNKLTTDVSSVRGKYPELNPKSDAYNPELEKEIKDHYDELDFDEATQSYRGNHSLASITDRFMRTAGFFKNAGSKQAQTIVKQKILGKGVTNKAGTKVEAESTDPATAIGQRISKMRNQ